MESGPCEVEKHKKGRTLREDDGLGRTSAERGFTSEGGLFGWKTEEKGRRLREEDGLGRASAERGFTFEGGPFGVEKSEGRTEAGGWATGRGGRGRRAGCRERVEISVGAVSLKEKG